MDDMDIGEIIDIVIALGNVMSDINDVAPTQTQKTSVRKGTQADINKIFG